MPDSRGRHQAGGRQIRLIVEQHPDGQALTARGQPLAKSSANNWTEAWRLWARELPQSAGELQIARKTWPETTVVLETRRQPRLDLTTRHRLRDPAGRILQIGRVLDIEGRGRTLRLLCAYQPTP
jgi:head-tail adaptor